MLQVLNEICNKIGMNASVDKGTKSIILYHILHMLNR